MGKRGFVLVIGWHFANAINLQRWVKEDLSGSLGGILPMQLTCKDG